MARKLEVEIVGDASSFQRALGQASGTSGKFGSRLRSVGKLAAVGLGVAGAAAGAAGVKMIGLGADAEEVESKFRVIFGRQMPKLTKQIDAFAEATGASRFELREQVADLGALIQPLVGSTKQAGKMSVAVAKLATDLGSFNNVPVEDALIAIRAGLVGEAEPLRRFGILLNAAATEAEALRMGLVKQGEELTEAQKVRARYSLIMKQSTLAQGDAERTAGSMTNQLKRLKNSVRDAGTEIGIKLIPVALAAVSAFNEHWPKIREIAGTVFRAIAAFIENVGVPAFNKLREVAMRVVGWFRKNWPEIRKVAGKVAAEIRTNVVPLLAAAFALVREIAMAVVKAIRQNWPQISATLRAVWSVVRPILQLLGALLRAAAVAVRVLAPLLSHTLRAALAIIRGVIVGVTKALGVVRTAFWSVVGAVQTLVSWIHSAISAFNSLRSKFSLGLPDPTPGFDIPGVPGFAHGGVVPGRVGSPQLIMAHGGETVLPTHRTGFRAGGGGDSSRPAQINLHVDGRKLASVLVDLDREHRRANGGRGLLP